MNKKKIIIGLLALIVMLVAENGLLKTQEVPEEVATQIKSINTSDYKMVTSSPCDLTGERKENVVVDIGYDSTYANREYYAFTNENSQLFYVYAPEIILQNDDEENNGDDRYCSDEAKVPGVEASDLDEGHVIADSLGGVSNAYNITPQDSTVNRSGAQADFEEEIRQALSSGKTVTNFNALIVYDDTETMIPASYKINYQINDTQKYYEFENK